MYDITGTEANGLPEKIRKDWEYIEGKFKLSQNPSYARETGKPVVGLWGFGFGHNKADPLHLVQAASYFRSLNYYLILGVPYGWRDGGVKQGYNVNHFLDNANMIQPWSVGSYRNSQELRSAANVQRSIKDKELCIQHNVDYQRVIWPGFAWSNWNGGERNAIPRKGGQFMRDQFSFSMDVEPTFSSLFIAMFDEFDEGTAIAKAARDKSMIPVNQYFLTLDADGQSLASDHYLKLAGELTNIYHEHAARDCDLHRKTALKENEYLGMNCRITSNNNRNHLVIQNNGYVSLYGQGGRIWKSPNKDVGQGPWVLFMQNDGNLVLYDRVEKPIWASNTPNKGQSPYRLEVQDDNKLVLYDQNNKIIWTAP
jgi:hypothetical protein